MNPRILSHGRLAVIAFLAQGYLVHPALAGGAFKLRVHMSGLVAYALSSNKSEAYVLLPNSAGSNMLAHYPALELAQCEVLKDPVQSNLCQFLPNPLNEHQTNKGFSLARGYDIEIAAALSGTLNANYATGLVDLKTAGDLVSLGGTQASLADALHAAAMLDPTVLLQNKKLGEKLAGRLHIKNGKLTTEEVDETNGRWELGKETDPGSYVKGYSVEAATKLVLEVEAADSAVGTTVTLTPFDDPGAKLVLTLKPASGTQPVDIYLVNEPTLAQYCAEELRHPSRRAEHFAAYFSLSKANPAQIELLPVPYAQSRTFGCTKSMADLAEENDGARPPIICMSPLMSF